MSGTIELIDRTRGSLLGGALGDAFGAPIEFMRIDEIHAQYGPTGLRHLVPSYGRSGAITDDTQMTLFTAEGMLRAHNRFLGKGIADVASVVWHAYLRWLVTQGEMPSDERFMNDPGWPDGWLISVDALHSRRAPGNTCLSALQNPRPGTIQEPLNNSKGCGAVMRAAPVGMLCLNDPFETGCEVGALTHGHPSGYLTAGYLAELISALLAGTDLDQAVSTALDRVRIQASARETTTALERALDLSTHSASWVTVTTLGEGWVAEEALAIAVYCALVTDDPWEAIVLAANHGGDSDSTAAITGNIVGATHGINALPANLLDQVELREEIEQLAKDIACHHEPFETDDPLGLESPDWDRYPGW